MIALVVSFGLLIGAVLAGQSPMTGVALIIAITPIVALLSYIISKAIAFFSEPFPPFRWW